MQYVIYTIDSKEKGLETTSYTPHITKLLWILRILDYLDYNLFDMASFSSSSGTSVHNNRDVLLPLCFILR